jgi:peptide/nickel transport system permease protein
MRKSLAWQRSPRKRLGFCTRLSRRPYGFAALLVLVAFVVVSILAPVVAPYSPFEMHLAQKLLPPSGAHPFGTDLYGRDILSRLIYGGRTTFLEAGLAVSVAMVIGALLGFLASSNAFGIGRIIVKSMDLWLAFPSLLLALLIVAAVGPGVYQAGVAVGLAAVPIYARTTRSALLSAKQMPYVESARAIGCGAKCIWTRYLWPSALSTLIVLATGDVGWAIMNTAALGFLGVGSPPPVVEWGTMLLEGRKDLWLSPWSSFFPWMAISITVLSAIVLGDTIADLTRPWQE